MRFSFSKIMVDQFFALKQFPEACRTRRRCLSAGLLLIAMVTEGRLSAQAPRASAYPVDPVAAAGMTNGLPNGVTSQQAEMMQVRTSAQGAQGEAVAASMARSVDQTIEERNHELALQAAREKKSLKTDIANRLKFEKASESYNKVSSNEMSTWKTQSGGVKVERNVPDAFLMALITEEEQLAARGAEEKDKKRFSLFNKKGEESSGAEAGGGLLSAVWPPRLPGFGRGGAEEASPYAGTPASDTSEPVFDQSAVRSQSQNAPQTVAQVQTQSPQQAQAPLQSTTAPAAETVARSTIVPRVSGAELVDGRPPGNQSAGLSASGGQSPASADQTPDPVKKKSGLLSMFQAGESDDTSSFPVAKTNNGSGGLFGFGKKKAEPAGPMIDASLFPTGAVSQAPTGGELQSAAPRPSEAPSVAQTSVPAAAPAETFATTSSVELPGTTQEKEKRRLLALPPMPSLTKGERAADAVPTLTTVNSAGTSYYAVSSTAQFMVYGENQMQSEIKALPAGTVVLMTKPGEQWASVRLPDGTEGVVQNKNLRPAASGESGGNFAVSAQ